MNSKLISMKLRQKQRAAYQQHGENRRHTQSEQRPAPSRKASPSTRKNVDAAPSPIAILDERGNPRKQSDILLDIGKSHFLFHSKDGNAYARVEGAVYPIESASYREKIMHQYLTLTGKGASRAAVRDTLDTLLSLAKFDGPESNVWLRTGYNRKNNIVIDLGRPDRRMIEVDPEGWRYCINTPNFQRSQAMMPLPDPAEPDFDLIWKYVNFKPEDRPLVAAWLLAAVRPSGPYPILILSGEQGTGKTSAARLLRQLVDPSASLVRAPPKDIRDLLVGAKNSRVLSLDNLSTLKSDLSDALCRISTGGAIAERTLYTNTDEVLVEVQRPVIINGIEDLASRPDLSERSLHIELRPMSARRTEQELNRDFAQDWPHVFSGLIWATSAALRDHDKVGIQQLPRMADFAKWACAGLPAFGYSAEVFLAAYQANINDGMNSSLESSPIGRALVDFIRKRGQWQATSSELLAQLGTIPSADLLSPAWPKSPRGLTGALTRLAPALRVAGIQIEMIRNAAARTIRLRCHPV